MTAPWLLLGLASALRRSELAALAVADLGLVEEGVKLSVVRGKTDQEAAGQIVGVVATGTPTCPVAALRTWMEAAGITDDAVFRAIDRHGRIAADLPDRAIALIVKRRVTAGCWPRSPRHSVGEQEEWTTHIPIPPQSLAGDSGSVEDQGGGPASSLHEIVQFGKRAQKRFGEATRDGWRPASPTNHSGNEYATAGFRCAL